MSRNKEDLNSAIEQLKTIKDDFWRNVKVTGRNNHLNQELEKAGRVADFIELGSLMCHDALNRNESCGGHFREEYQTEDGEALRNDETFSYVSAWKYNDENLPPKLFKENLIFKNIELKQRSYK